MDRPYQRCSPLNGNFTPQRRWQCPSRTLSLNRKMSDAGNWRPEGFAAVAAKRDVGISSWSPTLFNGVK